MTTNIRTRPENVKIVFFVTDTWGPQATVTLSVTSALGGRSVYYSERVQTP
jgi:hypothetical protein